MRRKKVILVTGASRGAGKGIACGLAKKFKEKAVIYVTARSRNSKEVYKGRYFSGTDKELPGSLFETAEIIEGFGSKVIPIVMDHADDVQTEELFTQIEKESGFLDILVNNATLLPHQLMERKPFWEKALDAQDILNVGLRTSYVSSWYGAKMMAKQKSGLIIFTSSFGANCYMHGPAYGAQKAGIDKFAYDMAVDLAPFNVQALSIWMGVLLTERTAIAAKLFPEQYAQMLENAETAEFTGYIIAAMAEDKMLQDISGQTVIAAEIAKERYQIIDRNGKQPPSHRDMLGAPPERNATVIY